MRCAVVGEGALALRCLQALQARGMALELLCSPDGSLAEAAAQLGLVHLQQRNEWAKQLAALQPDYLFSVRNPWILNEQELGCVGSMAVNFHDSLLPSYAGMHATTWALIHGETVHGVTWHEVTPGIDAGRVLAQVQVPVQAQDTAFTLNTRCFEAAAQAFDDLLDRLLNQAWSPQPQMGQRSYFGARLRPAGQAMIDPDAGQTGVLNLVRALDFGPAHNPIGLPKLWLGDRWLVARQARALPGQAGGSSAISGASDTSLQLGTSSGDVELSGLSWLSGEALQPGQLHQHLAGLASDALPALSSAQRAVLSSLHQRVCLKERAWTERLRQGVHPVASPSLAMPQSGSMRGHHDMPKVTEALAKAPSERRAALARATLALYLARAGRATECDLGLIHPDAVRDGLGLFATVLPVRVAYDPALTVDAWVQQITQQLGQTQVMDTFALDLLSRSPALRGGHPWPAVWPVALLTASQWPDGQPLQAAMVFWVPDDAARVQCCLFNETSSALINAMDAHWASLIESALDRPHASVGQLSLVSGDDRHRMLVSWNDTAQPMPDGCVHDLIAQQVRRAPQAIAARQGADVLSYAALHEHAGILANELLRRGVQPGELVGLAVQRSFDVLIGMLGIMRAGAAYVPLDPDYPQERIESMVRQSAARVVLTHQRTHQGLAYLDDARLLIDGLSAASCALPDTPFEAVWPERMVYCIFTSGSSGAPKGVEISHRSLLNHALAVQSAYGLHEGSRVLLSASISFDVAAEQIFPALISGAEVVIRPDDLFESLDRFDAFVRDQHLSVLTLPTAWWHEWVRYLAARGGRVPPALSVVGVGTEKVLGAYLAQWQALGGLGKRFIQGYGPTEATITCTMYFHDGEQPADAQAPLPIGRPLANMAVYVLDEQGEPVPVGMEGEIHVGGLGLARGYLWRPDLTAQHFVPHPFSDEPGARLYKTGDLGYFNAEGQLIYVGRADFQVKVRGFRVELGEIEATLRQHPVVRECVVILREDAPGVRRLVAYVIGDGGVDPALLQAHCSQLLPEHMVPADVVVLDKFPITINGKVDRRALPAPRSDEAPSLRDADYHDDLEYMVAQAFARTLGCAQVPLQASFFDLGGDSLSAMTMMAQLESALSVKLSLSELFDAPSVVAFSERIRSGSTNGTARVMQLKGGSGVPVWLLAGVMHYVHLARAMKGDNPVYVVLLPLEEAMIRHGTPLPTFDVLAERYMEVVRRHTPHGPYVIGGFSFGGAVAYEVCRRLREQGERVDQLLLFDTVLPGALSHGGARSGPWARLANVRRTLMARGWRGVIDKVRHRMAGATSERALPQEERERRRMEAARMAEFARVLRDFEQGMQPYEGAVVLYRAKGEDARRIVTRGHGFAPGVKGPWAQFEVNGDHTGMMTPGHVEAIAQDLDARLRVHASQQATTDFQGATV